MAKNSATKGAKKSRRMGRPRTEGAKIRCAKRKAARRVAQDAAHARNVEVGCSVWDEAKAARYDARH